MGKIGLDDIHRTGDQERLEIPARVKPLAQGDGDAHQLTELRQSLRIL
jgi:hypothetical protein